MDGTNDGGTSYPFRAFLVAGPASAPSLPSLEEDLDRAVLASGEPSADPVLFVEGEEDEAGVKIGVEVMRKLDPLVVTVPEAAVEEPSPKVEVELELDEATVTLLPLASGLGW